MDRKNILTLIEQERDRQDLQWGGPEHDRQHRVLEWARFIEDFTCKLIRERDSGYPAGQLQLRLVQIAALCVAALEHAPDLQEPATVAAAMESAQHREVRNGER